MFSFDLSDSVTFFAADERRWYVVRAFCAGALREYILFRDARAAWREYHSQIRRGRTATLSQVV